MMKQVMVALLIAVSTGAYGGWARMTTSEGCDYYFDPNTVKSTAIGVRAWELLDCPKGRVDEGIFYKSVKVLVEFDCGDERERTLSSTN